MGEMKGHNQPPVELSEDHARTILAIIERDLGQGLALLNGCTQQATAEKIIGMMELIKPIRASIQSQLKE